MKQIIYKTYKSEQALLNQQGYFRAYFNQIRKDKSTTKFKKIKTSGYKSILEEMYEYKDNEYICAGLNSFEREVLVIDNDDETFGKSTLDALASFGLVPHCQKVKANGHSQTYFFIERYKIGSAGFVNGKYYENDNFEKHEKYKRLIKMMNYLFNGDLGYTGYNCQNPLYINANVTSYRNITKKYSFDELYKFCLDKMSDIENLDEFLRKMRSISMKDKKHIKVEKEYEIIYIFENKQINLSSINSVNNNKVITSNDIDVEATIDNAIKEQEKYINERIFISCCKTCKSFYQNGQLSYTNLDYISRTAYKDFTEVDFADGYACQELINRIRNDIRQIIYNNLNNKMDWNKVGYTNKQRELSLKIRRNNKKERQERIENILIQFYSVNNNKVITSKKTNKRLTKNDIEKYVKAELHIKYDIDVGITTIKKDIKEIENNKDKQSIQINSVNNNKVITSNDIASNFDIDTNYIENLASLALDISNKKEESLYGNQN